MSEKILLTRASAQSWRLLWTDDNRDPYVANADAIGDVLTMIECGRMGELTKQEIRRLHFYMDCYGDGVTITVDVLGTEHRYLVSKTAIRLETAL